MALPNPQQAIDDLVKLAAVEGIPTNDFAKEQISNWQPLEGILKLPANPDPLLFNISADVVWTITDSSGNTLGTDKYLFDQSADKSEVSYIIRPIIQLSSATVVSTICKITATISLTASAIVAGVTQPVKTSTPKVIDFPIGIPTLRVPEVFVGSIGNNFGQGSNNRFGVMVVARSNGIDSLNTLNDFLDNLKTMTANLSTITKFGLQGLGSGVTTLIEALKSAAPNIAFKAADEIKNLNDYVIWQGGFWENDIEAEDEFRSVLLLSGSNGGMKLFENRDYKKKWVRFYIDSSTPVGVLVCKDLGDCAALTGLGAKSDTTSTTNIYKKDSSLKWDA